jgi:hypothetical protein
VAVEAAEAAKLVQVITVVMVQLLLPGVSQNTMVAGAAEVALTQPVVLEVKVVAPKVAVNQVIMPQQLLL